MALMVLAKRKVMKEKELYIAPQFEVVECNVEFGFANTLGDPFTDPEIDW